MYSLDNRKLPARNTLSIRPFHVQLRHARFEQLFDMHSNIRLVAVMHRLEVALIKYESQDNTPGTDFTHVEAHAVNFGMAFHIACYQFGVNGATGYDPFFH